MRLGILDQMAQPKGMTAEETAARTIELAKYAEDLGYERYWFAEHHGTKGLVSSAPEIMMAAVAGQTKRIAVGSGGILLPQYSAYKVAAQLLQLQALYPGRIEAGVGRSPGGNERIRSLLADGKPNQMGDYPEKLTNLLDFIQRNGNIKAAPRTEKAPELYSLGLGENSAASAAEQGIGYVFGHFIKPDRGEASHKQYREMFKPGLFPNPVARTAVFVVCGEDDDHAEELARSQDLWLLQVEKGLDSRVPSVQEANEKILSITEEEKIQFNRRRMIIGGPDKVKSELLRLSELYQCDDWLILTNLYDFKEKQASYRRIKEQLS